MKESRWLYACPVKESVQKAEIVSLLVYSRKVEATYYALGGRGTGQNKSDHEIPGLAFKLRTPPTLAAHTLYPTHLAQACLPCRVGRPTMAGLGGKRVFILTNYTT